MVKARLFELAAIFFFPLKTQQATCGTSVDGAPFDSSNLGPRHPVSISNPLYIILTHFLMDQWTRNTRWTIKYDTPLAASWPSSRFRSHILRQELSSNLRGWHKYENWASWRHKVSAKRICRLCYVRKVRSAWCKQMKLHWMPRLWEGLTGVCYHGLVTKHIWLF